MIYGYGVKNTVKNLIGWNLPVTFLISIGALVFYRYFDVILPHGVTIHQVYFSLLGILTSLLLADAEKKRIRLVEKLSAFASSIICLALAYDQRAPQEKNTYEMRVYFAEGLNKMVSAFKRFLDATTKRDLNLYTLHTIELDDALDMLSWRNEMMRKLGVPPNEISRASQYINKISDAIEFVRLFKFYTSSKLVRWFLMLLVVIGIWIFTPYYLTIPDIGIFIGPGFAIIFSLALNIQAILDNPVNGTGYIDQIQTNFEVRFRMRIQELLFNEDRSKEMLYKETPTSHSDS